jgi:hypothetical protein
MESNKAAEIIAEELLEVTGSALLKGDFERFNPCFDLPLRLETIEGFRTINTQAEFREVFEDVRDHMDDTDVMDFVRTVISATFIDPDTIGSIHICSEIYRGGVLERPAYPVRSVLRRSGERWKIVSCFYVILDSANHNAAIVNTAAATERHRRALN